MVCWRFFIIVVLHIVVYLCVLNSKLRENEPALDEIGSLCEVQEVHPRPPLSEGRGGLIATLQAQLLRINYANTCPLEEQDPSIQYEQVTEKFSLKLLRINYANTCQLEEQYSSIQYEYNDSFLVYSSKTGSSQSVRQSDFHCKTSSDIVGINSSLTQCKSNIFDKKKKSQEKEHKINFTQVCFMACKSVAERQLQPGDDIVLPSGPLPPAVDTSISANLGNFTSLDGICAAPHSPPSCTAILTTRHGLKPRWPVTAQQECRHLSSAHRTEVYASDGNSEINVRAAGDSHLFAQLLRAIMYFLAGVAMWHYMKIPNPHDNLRVCVIPNQPALPPALPDGSCYVHPPPPRPPSPPLELEFHHRDLDEDRPNFGDVGRFQSSSSPQHPSENLESALSEGYPKKSTLVLGRRVALLLHDEADQLLPGNLSSKLPENVVVSTHTSGKELLATAEVPFYSEEEEEKEGDEQYLHHQYRPSEEDKRIQPTPPAKISKDGHLGTTSVSKVDARHNYLGLSHVPNPPPNTSLISIRPPPPPPLPPSNGNLDASFLDENGRGVNYCMGGPPCFVVAGEIEFLPPLPPPPPDEELEEFDCCFDHPVIKLFQTPSGPD